MNIHTVTCRLDEQEQAQTFSLESGLQVMSCPNAETATKIGQGLCSQVAGTPGDYSGVAAFSDAIEPSACAETWPHVTVDDAAAAQSPFSRELMFLSVEQIVAMDNNAVYDWTAEALASLVDTGTSRTTLLSSLARLDALAGSIGREGGADAPLPRMRARLDTLKAEYKRAREAHEQRMALAPALALQRDRLLTLRAQYRQLEQTQCALVLCAARELQERLDVLHSEIRDAEGAPVIDPDKSAAIQRTETLVETSRLQLERIRGEWEQLKSEMQQTGEERGAAGANMSGTELPEQWQRDIRAALGRITELNGRIDEVKTQIATLDNQIAATQEQLATLPDYSRIAPSPVDWLNQLGRSFKAAMDVREEECALRDQLRDQARDLRVEIAGDAAIFDNSRQFAQELIAHENKKRVWETKSAHIHEQVQQHANRRDELQEAMPGLFTLGVGCTFALLLLLGVYVGLPKTPILIPTGLFLLSTCYYTVQIALTRRAVAQLTQRIAECHAEMDLLEEEQKNSVSQIERLMARAGCDTVRELEARYDRYRDLRARLIALEEQCKQQEANARESEERIPKLFERIRSTLEQVDEPPKDERDVEAAVGRAVAKYQVYRENKRRLADLRNQHQGLIGRRRFLDKEQNAVRERMLDAERQLRERMRACGFVAESEHKDINIALAAYYRNLDAAAEATSNQELLEHRKHVLEARIADDETLLRQHIKTLNTLLEEAGVDSVEEARRAAATANTQRDRMQERRALLQQLETLLQGRDLDDWRRRAGVDHEILDGNNACTLDAVVQKMEALEQQLNETKNDYRAKHREYRRLGSHCRTIQAYEEDRASVQSYIELLETRLSAAARAMALMEETLIVWRSRHAEAISERAEAYMRLLGVEAHIRLHLAPDAAPRLEIKVAQGATASPKIIALAMRLAAVDVLTDSTNPSPLIVDAAMRDLSLPVSEEGLLAALSDFAKDRQVLLVSDNERLRAVADNSGVPVVAL